MLLQPLVENAIRHGVAPLIEGGAIAIASVRRGDRLLMTIRNSGLRSKGNSLQDGVTSKGIGLANTAERLKTLYGVDQRFSIRSPTEGGCEVTIEIPLRKNVPTTEGAVCGL
jgi:two-component system sensor histidine kinase AlgZ